MESKKMKQRALVIQLLGLGVMLLGTHGFFAFRGPPLYLPVLIVSAVIFAVCLFKGGAMHKKARELEKQQGS